MENKKLVYTLTFVSVVVVIMIAAYGLSGKSKKIFMNGELSVEHSAFEGECELCHKPWEGVTWESCAKCHAEKRHFKKAATSGKGRETEQLTLCFSCHVEHKGRNYKLTTVSGSACEDCHKPDPHLEKKSGEIRTIPKGTILFTHLAHYYAGIFELDECDSCHMQGKDGEAFLNASYDGTCGSCHLLDEHDSNTKISELCVVCHPNNEFYKENSRRGPYELVLPSHTAHPETDCNECHLLIPPDFDEKAVSANPSFSDCITCHEKRKINENCGTCHEFHVAI